jgi:hypothetical protein
LADQIGATLNTVSRWERGLTDCSPYFRAKLCELFGKDARELGFIFDDEIEPAQPALYDPFLPAQRRLVGRNTLLSKLKEQFYHAREERIFALTGLPGVGKSALAIAIAHDPDLHEHFPDGILWANLGPEPDILTILSRWSTLLGVTENEVACANPDRKADRLLGLRSVIGLRRMLIIVDNIWDLEDALPLLQLGGTYCTFLITTRFVNIAVNLAGEHILTVPELSEGDALQLFAQLAPVVVKAEPQSARSLVKAVGGLPLALLLMGQYLRVQSHTQQPRRLSFALEWLHDAEKRLRLEQPALSFEQPMASSTLSLQATIALSDHHLQQEAREALRKLSVFPAKPSTFSEQAALFVTEVSADVLDSLSDAKLLESQGPGRYSLHQCIADYAALHNVQETAAQRMVEYFAHFVEAQQKDHESLLQESTNIFAALKLASKHRMVISQIRMVTALFDFLEAHGFADLARENLPYLQCSVRTDEDFRSLLDVLCHLSKLGWIQDTRRCHVYHCDQSLQSRLQELLLAIPQSAADHSQSCQMLSLLGVNVEASETYLSTMLKQLEHPLLCKQLDTQQNRQIPSNALAASRTLRRELTLARQKEDATQVCVFLANLAAMARQQNNYPEAERLLEEGLSIAAEHEDSRALSLLLIGKVHLAFAAHKFEETSHVFQRILDIVPQEQLLATARYYSLVCVASSTE